MPPEDRRPDDADDLPEWYRTARAIARDMPGWLPPLLVVLALMAMAGCLADSVT